MQGLIDLHPCRVMEKERRVCSGGVKESLSLMVAEENVRQAINFIHSYAIHMLSSHLFPSSAGHGDTHFSADLTGRRALNC